MSLATYMKSRKALAKAQAAIRQAETEIVGCSVLYKGVPHTIIDIEFNEVLLHDGGDDCEWVEITTLLGDDEDDETPAV